MIKFAQLISFLKYQAYTKSVMFTGLILLPFIYFSIPLQSLL